MSLDITKTITGVTYNGNTFPIAGGTLQTKSVLPTTSAQNITPDSGYYGLSQVNIGAIQTETKSVTPSTSSQTITPTSGKYLSVVTVGAIQTETKTVALDMSSGDQTISATSGKYITSATINKPATMLPENIKKDVVIGGVTGTYEGSGSGGTWDFAQYASKFTNMFTDQTASNLPSNLVVTIPSGSGEFQSNAMFQQCNFKSLMTITINNPSNRPLNIGYMFFISKGGRVTSVTFTGGVKPSKIDGFGYVAPIDNIYGEIDLSDIAAQWSDQTFNIYRLQRIYFKPNCIKFNYYMTMYGGPTVDDSIISIANGLNESVTDKTIALGATCKTRCGQIVGTVSLDDTQTYHIFTQDASGTTTLEEFITNTKGWTFS